MSNSCSCGLILGSYQSMLSHVKANKGHKLTSVDVVHKLTSVDVVNNPPHYNQGGIECIDYIKSSVKDFASYCHGNAAKYLHRHAYKGNPVEDLDKAIYYINKLKETYEK